MPIGRFAPSPTGPLHFGSLLAAVSSYCDIRQQGGSWLLRIDDIDGPRSVAGSAQSIMRSLNQYGFSWEGPVRWQSENSERYASALRSLVEKELVFACQCSRKTLAGQKLYPGHCRNNPLSKSDNHPLESIDDKAIRISLIGQVSYTDRILGEQSVDLAREVGDSIVWRRDKLVTYALACALDDASDVTDVVRGADLLDSTATQIAIMQCLSLTVPSYAHIPIAIDNNGDKLSKHSKALAIDKMDPLPTLQKAWQALGQEAFIAKSIVHFWDIAFDRWDLMRVPRKKTLRS